MARPRKSETEKSRPREIYATDEVWAQIKADAAASGLSVSRHLLERRGLHLARPRTELRSFQQRQKILQALERIAAKYVASDIEGPACFHLRLIALERWALRDISGKSGT